VRTADNDSSPVPYDTFRFPRAVLNWKPRYRAPVSRLDLLAGSRAQPRASTDEFEDEPTKTFEDGPTKMMEGNVLVRRPERSEAPQILLVRAAARLDAARARAAQLWRDGQLRAAAMMGGVAIITYLSVGGMRHDSSNGTQAVLAPPALALPALEPIIVEQLNGARQPDQTAAALLRGEQSDRPSRRSASSRARETPFATAPARRSAGAQAIAPAQSKVKTHVAERSSTTMSSSSAGLPAWGAEAMRDFSDGASSKGARTTSGYRPTATATVPAREQTADVLAAEPAEPPKPVAPPRPTKPLSMDEMLNQIEEVAQAQRKQAGLKAPTISERDAELDELISGAMKSKKK
jgi:hypothetical protein